MAGPPAPSCRRSRSSAPRALMLRFAMASIARSRSSKPGNYCEGGRNEPTARTSISPSPRLPRRSLASKWRLLRGPQRQSLGRKPDSGQKR
jgi:hypothetical protein